VTPDEFKAWMAHMGLSERRAAEALGVSAATIGDWARGTSRTSGNPVAVDRRTGLACAALAAGLEPWPAPPPKKRIRTKEKKT
jgi:transcriptional regulator with XRE-family HTH domain